MRLYKGHDIKQVGNCDPETISPLTDSPFRFQISSRMMSQTMSKSKHGKWLDKNLHVGWKN